MIGTRATFPVHGRPPVRWTELSGFYCNGRTKTACGAALRHARLKPAGWCRSPSGSGKGSHRYGFLPQSTSQPESICARRRLPGRNRAGRAVSAKCKFRLREYVRAVKAKNDKYHCLRSLKRRSGAGTGRSVPEVRCSGLAAGAGNSYRPDERCN